MRHLALLSLALAAGCQCAPGGTPPTVTILTPGDFTFLDGVGPHPVSGEVTDPDEILPPDRVTWRSDRDGRVGQGAITTITLSPGEHRLTLEAIDRDGLTGSAQVSVFVRVPQVELDGGASDAGVNPDGGLPDGGTTDTAPVASITQPADNAFFDEGQPITLLGAATDREDGALTGGALVWTSDRAGVIGSGAMVTFSNAALGAHRVVLTATDRSGRTGLASISLTVVRPGTNRPPVVTIASPMNGARLTVGTPAMLQGSALDPEDGALTGAALRWSSSASGALGTGVSLSPTLTQGVHTLTLTATDSMGASGTASVVVSVNQANNQPPTATITAPASAQTIFQGSSVTFAGTGSDPEDGALTGMALSWSSSLDGALGTGSPLSTSTLTTGDHVVTLVARDSGGNTGTATVAIRVLPMNQAPVVAITAPANGAMVAAGTSVTFTGTATDAEDGPLSGAAVRWSSSRDGALGTGTSLTTASLSVGVHTITLTATDSGGRSSSTSLTLTVTMSTMNVPPLARLTGPTSGQATDVLTFDGSTSSDSDGTVVSYRFDFGDGTTPTTQPTPSATHAFSTAGTFTVTLTVTDDRGATATATLQVVIAPFVRRPVIVTATDADVGSSCAIATPGSRVFLAWTASVHPAVLFGELVNGTLQAEVVDGLGFNTGGQVAQYLSLRVDETSTPHLVYVRDSQVWYATKVAGTWVRERVDSPTVPYVSANTLGSTRGLTSAPSLALSMNTPSVLFASGLASPYRAAVATRTGANTWQRSVVPPTAASSSSMYPMGELVIDAAGRHLFAAEDFTGLSPYVRLFAWTPTATSSILPPALGGRASLALGAANKLLVVSSEGVLDVSLSATFTSSTMTRSLIETFSTSQHVVATDTAGLPRILANHGSSLEHVSATANPAFWDRLELGPVDSGMIGVSVDGANATRACFIRARKLMVY